MNILVLTTSLIMFVSMTFSQTTFNFFGIGFTYCDITNKEIKVESLFKSGPVGNVMTSEGFNHYEINLDTKTFIHNYAGDKTGIEDVSKITNMVKTKDYIKFDVKTDEFGVITCYINKNKNQSNQNQFLVKYKNGSKTEVAFFNLVQTNFLRIGKSIPSINSILYAPAQPRPT